ncbi:MarR family winged helix-turn-helix transcriptional regulator [Pseudomonas abieticivorans]|uniref:MarR family winged helix-turn-helix transcriptional regulator n=1 Tax=Pseudomonas abieticivorans TaxID=2931382 RepID=UPI0020BE3B4A|nr:MarR family transcriptional regulator [Pseudomonas sp. PIA16]
MTDLRLDNQLCFKLYAASRAVTRGYKPMLDALGLTYPQYLVMLVLWEWRDEPLQQPTVKALGQRLSLDSGTLTPLLKRLQQLALVERARAVADEREVHVSVTAKGLALRAQVAPLRERLICDSGVDLDRAQALAQGLDALLRQFN